MGLTKEAAAKKVISMIKKDLGKSFTELKKDILNTMEHGSSDHFKSPNGYSVFYTNNDNYQQGEKNGGGRGFYASLRHVGFTSTVKLSKK